MVGGAVPRLPASYVHRATARAARRDVMCRAGGDPLQVVLCERAGRGACAWTRGGGLERVVLTRAGGAGLARRLAAVVRRGRRGSARRAPCARAVRPDRGGAWSAGRLGVARLCARAGRVAAHGSRASRGKPRRCVRARGRRRPGNKRRASRAAKRRGGERLARERGRRPGHGLLRSAREEEGRARPALEWPSGERERGRGARSTGAERAERRGVARSGRAAEEEGSECASAAKAECAGQGRHARPGARARGQWRVRPALIAVGGRAMRRWRGKRERERGAVGEKGKVTWNQESGIGCSGQIKDFRNLGFRFYEVLELNDEKEF